MQTTGVRRLAPAVLVMLLLVLPLGGCGTVADFFRGSDVLETGIEPVELAFEGPTYAALVDGRLVLRDGDDTVATRGFAVAWLPDGRALVERRSGTVVVDPESGEESPPRRLWDVSRAVTQVNTVLGDGHHMRLRTFDLDLEPLATHDLPRTDNPDADDWNELVRNYFGAVPTIDGVTFVKWHDGSEWYEDGDYGVLRIDEDGSMTNVQVNANVVGHYLSADGSGLLGLRQVRGEPCGGCRVDQDIVEVDPATGELTEYGVPDDYTEDWRVAAMDKVGDRVAVRYYEPVERRHGRFTYEPRGTWVYDGEWTMVEGSTEELTWWQGAGRVVARVDETERRRGDGWDLFWVDADGEETPLPGELSKYPQGVPTTGSVAGQLLPRE